MKTITDLRELLEHELEDLYSAEVQLIEALPAMAEKASSPQLKKAFTAHLAVTREHKSRLDKVKQMLGGESAAPENKGFFARLFSSEEGETHCKAMEGLVNEATSLMREDMLPVVMDAALIAAAQKVEHYEISSYGTARAFALQLGLAEVEKMLKQTLDEEYAADDALTELALNGANQKASGVASAPKKSASKKAVPKKAAKKAAHKKAKTAKSNKS